MILSTEGVDNPVCADAIGWDSDGILDPNPEFIIDNPAASFAPSGWFESTSVPGYYGTNYHAHMEYTSLVADFNATLAESSGGRMFHRGSSTAGTFVCNTCHGDHRAEYIREPYLGPRLLMEKAEPDRVDSGVESQVVLTVYIYDPDNNISSVTIDLSSIGGSATQQMYDNGTHGDVTAGDNIYSFEATVPNTADAGLKLLTVTATDDDFLVNEADIELMVANKGWLIMDNYDADCRGYWGTSASQPTPYGMDYYFNVAGTGTDSAIFTPELPISGNYNVYAWWTTAPAPDRATN
ncbi:MAG: choice-of-anchor X domain-containing protein, partial [Pseudomonadota bacterium]